VDLKIQKLGVFRYSLAIITLALPLGMNLDFYSVAENYAMIFML